MSETPNYGLYLEDDASTKFQAWREKINGSDNSNMVKIDTALGTMAKKSGNLTATLLSSAWSGIDSPSRKPFPWKGLVVSKMDLSLSRRMQRLNNGTQLEWRSLL